MSNAGQIDSAVRYYSWGPSYGVYFTQEEAVFAFVHQIPRESGASYRSVAAAETDQVAQGMALALRFLGANPKVKIEGNQRGTARVNYLIWSDPAKWRNGLPTYQEIVYRELWPGIDLIFRQANGQLKYEFVLQPGARPEAIRLAYRGADSLSLDAAGNLLIKTSLGVLTDDRPKSYQVIGGRQVPVESQFAMHPDGQDPKAYGFAAGVGYNPRYSLIIDPGLGYSALLGGSATDFAYAIAVDGSGNAYVTGQTDSADFPTFPTLPTCPTTTTTSTYDTCFGSGTKVHGFTDAFVGKFGPSGALEWATYLGGSDADVAYGIAEDGTGIYVTGKTYSSDFPTTGAFRTRISGNSDAFVTKLTLDGKALIYSTFLGGGGLDAGHAIAVDGAGNAYVTGETLSSNFPVTPFAVFAKSQGKRDAFVAKLDTTTTGSASLVYSTYLGGSGDEIGFGIATACLDPTNPGQCDALVTGQTASPNFPTVLNYPSAVGASIDTALNGPTDAFVARLNADASALRYSTFLGGEWYRGQLWHCGRRRRQRLCNRGDKLRTDKADGCPLPHYPRRLPNGAYS